MNPIPERYRLVLNGGGLTPTEAMKAAQASFGDVLVLSGGIGTGKTLAACAWAAKRLPWEAFMTAAELARWPRYDMEAMRRLLSSPALVIDDLGTEYMDDKGNFMAVLDEVVNTRCANMRKTVVTTNLGAKAFRERYGSRITDRIVECGRFVSVTGDSLRKPENQPAVEAVRTGEIQRAIEAKAAELVTCSRHLYGGNGDCNERCPHWGKQMADPAEIRAAIKELASAKAAQ